MRTDTRPAAGTTSKAQDGGFARRARPYVLLGVAAFAIRLLFYLEWRGGPLDTLLVGDAAEYDRWARQVAGGEWLGQEVFYQAPLYPYFMALVYRSFGPSVAVLRVIQLLLGSAACVLLALSGRRFFDERVGLLAGALLACYGPAIHADALVQKGGLGGFLVALLLFFLAALAVRRGAGWALAAGASLGLLALTRENALLCVPVVVAWLLLADRSRLALGPRSVRAAACLAGLACVLVPIGLRNASIGDSFLVTTAQAGPNFWIGNQPGADGRYVPLREGRGSVRYERQDAIALAEQGAGRELSADEVSDWWLDRTLRSIGEAPGAWLARLARKGYLVWHAHEIMDTDSLEAHRDASLTLAVTSMLHFGVVVPLAGIGVVASRRRWRDLAILHALAVTLALSVVLFYVMARYRNPLVPFVLLFAAVAVLEIVRRVRARDWRWLAWASCASVALGVAVNWPLAGGLDPRAVTYYSLGQAALEHERVEEARSLVERALALEPEFAEAHVRLAEVLQVSGDSEGSERHLARSLELDPHHAGALTLLGSLRLAAGRMEEAEALYRRALELDAADPSAHNNLAILLAREGRLPQAIPHWRASLDAEPRDPVVWTNFGQGLAALGRAAEARQAFDRALALDPSNVEARRWLEQLDDPAPAER